MRETLEQGTLIWKHPCVNIPAVSVVFALWDHQLQPCTAFCTHGHFPLILLLISHTLIPTQGIDLHTNPKMHTTHLTGSVSLPKRTFKDVGSHEAGDGGQSHNDV